MEALHLLESALGDGLLALETLDRAKHNACPVRGSMLGNCPRELALRLAGVPEKPRTPESLCVLQRGHERGASLSRALSSQLESLGAQCTLEAESWIPVQASPHTAASIITDLRARFGAVDLPLRLVGDTVWVRSRIDLLAAWKDGDPWIVEIKTAGSYPFAKLESEGANPRHALQVALQASGLYGGARGFLLYECQDGDVRKGFGPGDHRLFEVDLPSWKEERDRTLASTREVLEAMLDGKLEEVPKDALLELEGRKVPWPCNYCSIGPDVCAAWGEVVNKGTNKKPKWEVV